MNAVEELLSASADVVENGLRDSEATRQEAEALLDAGSSPICTRVLAEIRGAVVVVTISRQ